MAKDKKDSALPEEEELKQAKDLALKALDRTENEDAETKTETQQSDEFAQTLHALENVIESKARKLMRVKQNAKKKRRMIKDVFENDQQMQEVEEEREEIKAQLKQHKNDLEESIQIKQLREDLRETKQEQKEIEESLSNHLINYHQLTNSTSFDTSDGDQWEFKIKAKVRSKKV